MMRVLTRCVFVLCLASCLVATALLAQSDGNPEDAIRVEVEAVNVKGKSLEGLGALAGGLGVAAQAVCLVEKTS